MTCVIIWQLPDPANFDCMVLGAYREAERLIDPQRGSAPAARDAPDYKLRSCQSNFPCNEAGASWGRFRAAIGGE
jgi:hypothetical protein